VSLPSCSFEDLLNLFSILYKDKTMRISKFVTQIKRVMLGNEVICSKHYIRSNGHGTYIILAKYPGITLNLNSFIKNRPAVINAIYEIKIVFTDFTVNHIVIDVSWFKEHDMKNFFGVNSPMKIWCTEFEDTSVLKLVPLKFVCGRILVIKESVRFSRFYQDVYLLSHSKVRTEHLENFKDNLFLFFGGYFS
jgi:hypothetical protein